MRSLKTRLKNAVLGSGAVLCGIANLKILPEAQKSGFPTGISYAVKYDNDVIDRIVSGPNPEYEQAYHELNRLLNRIGEETVSLLTAEGYSVKALIATHGSSGEKNQVKIFSPLNELKVTLPHKTVATLAGLGWIGKTDLLITEKYGPRIRLGTVLTDAPLLPDEPVNESQCGECDLCKKSCPVDAGRDSRWSPGEDRKYKVDLCYNFTKSESIAKGLGAQLCGICISVCPFGKKN